tara:strand:+ start:370 stop:654 length:285 start_codon:yes stop_codon:yes gene_type:complete
MSQSSLIYLCFGTALTAVSFLLFATSKGQIKSDEVSRWKGMGFKINSKLSLVLLVCLLPLIALIHVEQTGRIDLMLPLIVLGMCCFFSKAKNVD